MLEDQNLLITGGAGTFGTAVLDRFLDTGTSHLRNNELQIAFVGAVLPDDLCRKTPASSVAGNNYQVGLIKGLEKKYGQPLNVFSIKPLAMYPKSRTVLSSRGYVRISDLSFAKLMPFINLPILKQISILLSIFIHLSLWLWLVRKSNKRIIIVFNCFSPFSLGVLAATALMGGKPVAVIADLPHNMYDYKGMVRNLLQRIDFFIQTHSIGLFKAIIPITIYIARDFAPFRPALVIEGGVENNIVEDVSSGISPAQLTVPLHEKVVLYSGALDEINGIDLLMESFRFLPDPQYRLHIYGRGPLEALIKEASNRDERIGFGGILNNLEIKSRQAHATVLVNPRPSHREITRYTFPSKLLEYLSSGRPVITTLLPGIPEEYYQYLYLLRDETPKGLAKLIQYVCSQCPVELDRVGKRAKTFVIQHKNWNQQGQRIYEFISAF